MNIIKYIKDYLNKRNRSTLLCQVCNIGKLILSGGGFYCDNNECPSDEFSCVGLDSPGQHNAVDSFGEIDSIELCTMWDLDPLRDASMELLCNDISTLQDLYKNGTNSKLMRKARFPQSIEVTVTYPRCVQKWECFQTQEWIESLTDNINMYGSIVDNWASAKIETTSIGRGQAVWTKIVYGLKFHICSLTYKDNYEGD